MNPIMPRRRIEALKHMQARPGARVTCPVCGTGTLVAERIRGAADPDAGTRFVRCTHRGHHSEGGVRLDRLASAPGT